MFVRVGHISPLPVDTEAESSSHATAEEIHLFWKDAGAFLVRGGREIVVDPVPGVEDRVLRLCILGPALAMLLHQRGWLVLHASAVDIAGRAVAFLGGPGEGKSTMAAAMHARGHRLLADDVTAVRFVADHPTVFPAFPQLKLWPESAVALGNDPGPLPRLEPGLEKRSLRASRGFLSTPLTLKHIYVLAEGKTPHSEPLRPQQALVKLIGHSYAGRLLRNVKASAHFFDCAELVNNVAVSSLERPRSLPALPDVARLVEREVCHGM